MAGRNVLAVVSDQKEGIPSVATNWFADYYDAKVVSANDYYPFGMAMPGRTSNSPDYRYGFNGKEKDESGEWGELTHYDYGFRIYNAGIGRFLSVDPLTKGYPMLTPYQFASNRPIDGIDFDGLEYLTYKVLLEETGQTLMEVVDHTKMTDDEIKDVHGMSAEKFYRKHSVSYGKRGKGIVYEYYEEKDGEIVPKRTGEDAVIEFHESSRNSIKKFKYYGKFAGPGCLSFCGKDYRSKDDDNQVQDYDFTQTPIDQVDAIAKLHDEQYATIKPYTGFKKVGLEYDIEFVDNLKQYLVDAKSEDYKDPYTGRPASKDAIRNAKLAILYFETFLIPPKEKVKKQEQKTSKEKQ